RTLLRGLGVAVALPWLESALPARLLRGASACAGVVAGTPPTRLAFVFIPNGVDPGAWMPTCDGRDARLPPSLSPLEPFRERFSVLQGLAHRNAQALGDGPGDHARSAACFLTGAHPVKTAGRDIAAGVSVDQFAAQRIGRRTALASLELGCEPALQSGDCDSGYSCAYSANISWRTPVQPNLKEIRPREVFERLFGMGPAGESAAARAQRLAARQSILDFVRDDAHRLERRLGGSDRQRLDEYLDGVRALERRIESIERAAMDPAESIGEPPAPGTPADYRDHVRLMNELLVLAFRLDRTRIASFMLANEGSNRSFPFLEIPEGHHHLTHHGGNEAMVEKVRRINRFQSEMFADLLQRMDAVKEGEGTLLDHSMVLFGSAIADGNRHNHDDLPILLAGGGGGTLDPGRRVAFDSGTPLCNLFLSMLDRMGVEADRFGDSTGHLSRL
ncbi:MAG: DUF1552 domain-containing protein, partial [Phycisphaerales bacterium]|nr:DUF1552 domain-containing protein [Phycisphaerales bacterium]